MFKLYFDHNAKTRESPRGRWAAVYTAPDYDRRVLDDLPIVALGLCAEWMGKSLADALASLCAMELGWALAPFGARDAIGRFGARLAEGQTHPTRDTTEAIRLLRGCRDDGPHSRENTLYAALLADELERRFLKEG